MGVKISELPSTSSANTNDSLVLNHGSETSRITLQALMNSYLSGAGLVTDEELAESLQDYVAESEMPGYLSGYVTGSPGFLSVRPKRQAIHQMKRKSFSGDLNTLYFSISSHH